MQTFFYSPFSPSTVVHNRPLIVLFILKEVFKPSENGEVSMEMGPLYWTMAGSAKQKLAEHFFLLRHAFPDLNLAPLNPDASKKELFFQMAPFILACGPNENILLFLIQQQNDLAVKELLDKICPEGIDAIQELIVQSFRKRGYHWIYSSKTPLTS